MRMKAIILAVALAVLLVSVNCEDHHKKCCSTCRANYPRAHHLKHSCLRGCRLYSMIYLAHDKSIPDTELSAMCSRSCQTGFSGMMGGADGSKACLTGCTEQERIFKEHGVSDHGAKMSVVHGLGMTPEMHSEAPFHHSIFQQMRNMHERMLKAVSNVKHAVIQHIQIRIHALPPGPDGKPRYQVEIQQHRIPFVFGKPTLPFGSDSKQLPPTKADNTRPLIGGGDHDKKMHGSANDGPKPEPGDELSHYLLHLDRNHHHGEGKGPHHDDHHRHHHPHPEHSTVMFKVRHFFTDMSEPAKAALRWSLCGLLIASLLCLAWLCFRTCRRVGHHRQHTALPTALEKPRLSLTPALIKKKPGVEPSDIFYVDVSDKKPLIEDEKKEEA